VYHVKVVSSSRVLLGSCGIAAGRIPEICGKKGEVDEPGRMGEEADEENGGRKEWWMLPGELGEDRKRKWENAKYMIRSPASCRKAKVIAICSYVGWCRV
jgi:hypothetical protein